MKCIFRKLSVLSLNPPPEKQLSMEVPYATIWNINVSEGKSIEYPVIEIAMKPRMAAISIHVHWEMLGERMGRAREVRALLVQAGKQYDLYRAVIKLPLEFELNKQQLRFGLEVRGYLDDMGFSIYMPTKSWDLHIEQRTWLEDFYGGLTCEPILLLHPAERRVLNNWEGSTHIGKRQQRKVIRRPSPLKQEQ